MKAYQMKITVKGSKPPIWRRVIVPAGLNFTQLGLVFNTAMGWLSYHLYSFTFKTLGVEFQEELEESFWGDMEQYDASEYMIDRFVEQQKSFTYLYDFGDDWTHTVVVEKILDDYDKKYAEVIKSKGEIIPEDCGGIWGYYQLLDTLQNPEDPEYESLKEWYGQASDYVFDIAEVNKELKQMKLTKRKGKREIEKIEDEYKDFAALEERKEEDILLVVDMQNDFIDGTLGTKEAERIVPEVVKKIKAFQGTVFYTQDTHEENYLNTQEGKNLPVAHCIRGTKGWKLHPEIEKLAKIENLIVEKPTFGSAALAVMLNAMEEECEIVSITLIGLCTDICVISNAMVMKAFLPEVPIIVDSKCCAGVTPESHENALKAMKSCQIQIV